MHEKYPDVCDVVLKHKDHRDALIRKTVVLIIPNLANYNPPVFVASYLQKCMIHLLAQLKKEKDRKEGG